MILARLVPTSWLEAAHRRRVPRMLLLRLVILKETHRRGLLLLLRRVLARMLLVLLKLPRYASSYTGTACSSSCSSRSWSCTASTTHATHTAHTTHCTHIPHPAHRTEPVDVSEIPTRGPRRGETDAIGDAEHVRPHIVHRVVDSRRSEQRCSCSWLCT